LLKTRFYLALQQFHPSSDKLELAQAPGYAAGAYTVNLNLARARFNAAKVLLADDNTVTRTILRRMLFSMGIQTLFEAVDGISGIEKLCEFAPDAVILDFGNARSQRR
jgi:PleD family two-component response regulator